MATITETQKTNQAFSKNGKLIKQKDSIKQLKENTKKFIEYIETLPNEWSLNNLVKEEMKEYFDY